MQQNVVFAASACLDCLHLTQTCTCWQLATYVTWRSTCLTSRWRHDWAYKWCGVMQFPGGTVWRNSSAAVRPSVCLQVSTA